MRWVIVGAGAQGRIVLDILRSGESGDGHLFADDDPGRVGKRIEGVEIVDRDWLRENAASEPTRLVVALGHNLARLRVAEELSTMKARFGNVIHSSAVVMPTATLGVGVMVCPGAIIQSGANIGDHVLINTNAVVEHDCVIEDGVTISSGVHMAGRVVVARAAFVGAGASLNPRVKIGREAIVGLASAVTRNVRPGMLAYGVPAREIRPVEPERDWRRLL